MVNAMSMKNLKFLLSVSSPTFAYSLFTIFLIVGGLLNAALGLGTKGNNLRNVIYISLILFSLAIFIWIIQHIKISEKLKENFILTIMSISIPIMTMGLAKFYSSILWAFPFILIIIF